MCETVALKKPSNSVNSDLKTINRQRVYLSNAVCNGSQGRAERDVSVMCSTSESLSKIPVFYMEL